MSETELLSICLAPDHPTREHGLTVRRIQKLDDRSNSPSSMSTTKKTKRASSISILSGLGVRDPEKALDPPSPTSAQLSPALINAKRPSKLRNFFGQRPPSELITTHLTEYFPNAEKKVLERTARHSMMIRSGTISSKRQSTSSNQPLPSRFSSSTQGSGRRSFSPSRPSSSTLPPPVPEKIGSHEAVEDLPRMSLSTEDGRSVDLLEDVEKPQLLPPIPFPTESLSESMEGITGGVRQRPISRAMSIASKRMSYMTELRSKRDRSDTSSLMTVGEITAEVESRRASTFNEREADFDDWTKVDAEFENMVPKAVEESDEEVDDGDDGDDDDEGSSIDEDETLNEEELSLDVDDHGRIRNIMSARRGAFF